jgi:hypothetical protein
MNAHFTSVLSLKKMLRVGGEARMSVSTCYLSSGKLRAPELHMHVQQHTGKVCHTPPTDCTHLPAVGPMKMRQLRHSSMFTCAQWSNTYRSQFCVQHVVSCCP